MKIASKKIESMKNTKDQELQEMLVITTDQIKLSIIQSKMNLKINKKGVILSKKITIQLKLITTTTACMKMKITLTNPNPTVLKAKTLK